ncbi:hypothetical protein QLL71_005089 [Salmonella enterica]|nr:hypothetical protein [Salmonella enterica]
MRAVTGCFTVLTITPPFPGKYSPLREWRFICGVLPRKGSRCIISGDFQHESLASAFLVESEVSRCHIVSVFFIFHAALQYSGDTDLTEYYFDLSDKSISAYGTRFKDIHIPGENPFILFLDINLRIAETT